MANTETCKANDCNREAVGKGYCRKHYRMWKAGEMPKPHYKTCTAEKCHKPRFQGSLCEEHFKAERGSSPAAASPAAAPTPAPGA
jgi:hypothetical protein